MPLIWEPRASPPGPEINNDAVCSQGGGMVLEPGEPRIQMLSLARCVILGKSLNVSELPSLVLQHGGDSALKAGLLLGLTGVVQSIPQVHALLEAPREPLETRRQSCKGDVAMFRILRE